MAQYVPSHLEHTSDRQGDGRPLTEYLALTRKHNHNLREILGVIGRGDFKVK